MTMLNHGDQVAVVDLFCGIGGLSHGFYKEGFKVAAGIDSDPSCEYAFETNNEARFVNKPIEDITPNELSKLFGDVRTKVLIGCAPCQPFSPYNRTKTKTNKWKLLRDFSRLIAGVKPDIVSMENVPHLRNYQVFEEFVSVLEGLGYFVSVHFVFCPDYGIPQRRRRMVLIASKYGDVPLIARTHLPSEYRTVYDAIGRLRPLESGGKDPKDPMHRCRKLSPLNLKRVRSTPEGKAWQTWNYSLRPKCLRKKKNRSFRAVYGRMKWDGLGSTVTTEFCNLGTGRFGHPDQDRTISLREAAILQTFPKYYKFAENPSKIWLAEQSRHIGNAVPVRLGRAIAKSIEAHLKENHIA